MANDINVVVLFQHGKKSNLAWHEDDINDEVS